MSAFSDSDVDFDFRAGRSLGIIGVGSRVVVKPNRRFASFASGDRGVTVSVDVESYTCDVRFDGRRDPKPTPVALKHLSLEVVEASPPAELQSVTTGIALASSPQLPQEISVTSPLFGRAIDACDTGWRDRMAADNGETGCDAIVEMCTDNSLVAIEEATASFLHIHGVVTQGADFEPSGETSMEASEKRRIVALEERIECCEYAVKQIQNEFGVQSQKHSKRKCWAAHPQLELQTIEFQRCLQMVAASERRFFEVSSNLKGGLEQIRVTMDRHESKVKSLDDVVTANGQGLKRLAGLLEGQEKRVAELGQVIGRVDQGAGRIASTIDAQEHRSWDLERPSQTCSKKRSSSSSLLLSSPLSKQKREPIWQAFSELQELVVHESEHRAAGLREVLCQLAQDIELLRRDQARQAADLEKRFNVELRHVRQRLAGMQSSREKNMEALDCRLDDLSQVSPSSQNAHNLLEASFSEPLSRGQRSLSPVRNQSRTPSLTASAPMSPERTPKPRSSLLSSPPLQAQEVLETRFATAMARNNVLGKLRGQLQGLHSELVGNRSRKSSNPVAPADMGSSGDYSIEDWNDGAFSFKDLSTIAPFVQTSSRVLLSPPRGSNN